MDFKERLSSPVVMENPQADRVKDIAKLATRSARTKTGLFLVEGPQAVREALKAHQNKPLLDAVYITERAYDRHPDIVDLLEEVHGTPTPQPVRRVFMRMCTEPVLAAMAESVSPQGIIAVAFQQDTPLTQIWGEGAINPRLVAVLAQVQDPGNAGTILRAADAAGADLIITTKGSVDLYNPKAVRSTAGSLFHLPVLQGIDLEDFAEDAKAQGMGVLAADGYGRVSLDDLQEAAFALRLGLEPAKKVKYNLAQPTVWLFGNEAQGLSDQEKAAASLRVSIPLRGAAESLNVGMAAGVCLFASALAQNRPAGQLGEGS